MKWNFVRIKIIVAVICILSINSCVILSNSTKIGDAKVSVRGNEIVATNVPYPSVGIAGIGRVSWGDFSFEKFDEFIFRQAKKSSADELYIVIQHISEDQYGQKKLGKEITIGKVDVNESKKYADFYHWNLRYDTYDMYMKDYYEYERQYLKTDEPYSAGASVRIVPRYEPKSIR